MCVCVCGIMTQLIPIQVIIVSENEISLLPLDKLVQKVFQKVYFFFRIGLFISPINFPVKKSSRLTRFFLQKIQLIMVLSYQVTK
jgi:hypothetical protein